MRRAYQYRAYCNKETQANAERWLYLCRNLYNSALEQKILFFKQWNVDISIRSHKDFKTDNPSISENNRELLSKGINGQIPEIKEAFPEYKKVNSLTIIDVTDRLDKAYKAFFRRIKAGETPGFPRFKGRDRYDSFSFIGDRLVKFFNIS